MRTLDQQPLRGAGGKCQKAHRPAPLAGREEVGYGYENLPVILVENFASLPGSRTRDISVAEIPRRWPSSQSRLTTAPVRLPKWSVDWEEAAKVGTRGVVYLLPARKVRKFWDWVEFGRQTREGRGFKVVPGNPFINSILIPKKSSPLPLYTPLPQSEARC